MEREERERALSLEENEIKRVMVDEFKKWA